MRRNLLFQKINIFNSTVPLCQSSECIPPQKVVAKIAVDTFRISFDRIQLLELIFISLTELRLAEIKNPDQETIGAQVGNLI